VAATALAFYRTRFAQLNCQRSSTQWPQSPRHRAPYKPLLLLSLLDLIDAGRQLPESLIVVEDLADRFAEYCSALARLGWKTERARLAYPAFHLRTDGFWHLVALPGREQAVRAATGPTDMGSWSRAVRGIRLDAELAVVLRDPAARAELRATLLSEYFGPIERPVLAGMEDAWSREEAAYSSAIGEMVGAPFAAFHPASPQQTIEREVRDRVFRLWVVPAYDHTCAVCGLRVLTPEGHSAVQAAHIIGRATSHNDDPRNGLALCGVHHWSFDEGLISVGERHEVLLSRVVRRDDPRADLLARYQHARLLLPTDFLLHPAPEALEWHRANVFRGSSAA
jgi:putative restriction endonuclease